MRIGGVGAKIKGANCILELNLLVDLNKILEGGELKLKILNMKLHECEMRI